MSKTTTYNRKKGFICKKELTLHIREILKDSWGEFPDDFVVQHIIDSERVSLVYEKQNPTAVCSLDVLKIQNKKVYYIEFLAVKKKYQHNKIGSRLIKSMVIYALLKNIHTLFFRPLEIMFITPNIRILCCASKIAHFIYPNPYDANKDGSIVSSDEETWAMVQELLQKSDRPNRQLTREGSVLHDSYSDLPWLVYKGKNIPWHRNEKINEFAKKYLGYGKTKDKEFVVRMQLSLKSVLKYVTIR